MKSLLIRTVLPILSLAMFFGACKTEKNEPDSTPNSDPYAELYKIGEAEDANAGVKLSFYLKKEAFVGYNHAYVVVTDLVTGDRIENATVSFMPMMDMGSMMHSSPFEQPVWSEDAKAYHGTITYIMPSMAGTWTVKVIAENLPSSVIAEHTFTINVIEPAEARLYSFLSTTDNSKIFVALVEPVSPKTGLNPFNVVVYKKETMMNFPAVAQLSIEIDPEMPTMGHGSPNNVDPVYVDHGHYNGTVNFTMTGYWKVNMVIKDANGSMMKDDAFFDITFQ